MLAKKIKVKVDEEKKIVIHVPDMPIGEVEVIILREEKKGGKKKIKLPSHKVGKILKPLTRDKIYTDAR